MGDPVDNIPGLKGWGPVKTYDKLGTLCTPEGMLEVLSDAYQDDNKLEEMGRLCWIVRRLTENGEPEIWNIGITR
jgi:hypothetical protein